MVVEYVGDIALPPHVKSGGFDHAAVHRGLRRLYVAHTSNDALDIVDCRANQYARSIPGLAGVAGVLVSEERDLIFTSNRSENTVSILPPADEKMVARVAVGTRPNGLAYDPGRSLLLVANVGDPAIPGSCSVSIVDVEAKRLVGDVSVPGRTRWTVFDAEAEVFYVNIADPPQIAVIHASNSPRITEAFPIPAAGPHGLDIDPETRRLFCACDGKTLASVDARSGEIVSQCEISGVPDVVFFNRVLKHLYIAIGDPGLIEVFDTDTMDRLESIPTGRGAHTIAFDSSRNVIYALLPETHRAAIYHDRGRW